MGKKLQEHSSVVRPRAAREDSPTEYDQSGKLQAVKGGGRKRIVFEDERPDPVAEEQSIPAPRAPARSYGSDINEVERNVDNLYAWRSRVPLHTRRRFLDVERPVHRTIYENDGGHVQASRNSDHKETLYVTSREAGRDGDRRFVSSMVDRILARAGERPSEYEIVRSPETRKRVTEIKTTTRDGVKHTEKTIIENGVVKERVESDEPWTPDALQETKPAKKPAKATKPAKKAAKTTKPAKTPTKATKPAKKPAKAVAPVAKPEKLSFPSQDKQPQCAALTKAGGQCRNSARNKSKYCGAHKGYRAPTKAQLLNRLDTKPRTSGAKDTKPTVN